MADRLAVALVYPSLLGTYGDGGNALVLARRAAWRGHPAEVISVDVGSPLPHFADIYVLGGGEDSAQALAVGQLTTDGTLASTDAVVFAVCAGFQIAGTSWLDGTGRSRPGLGLLDAVTDRLPGARAVGECLADPLVTGIGPLTGYENHGGRTRLGPAATPLARVRSGTGNGDGGEGEGARQGRVIATYLHGPALARNPGLADHLLAMVLGPLAPLQDTEEQELRAERFAALRRSRFDLPRRQRRPPARGL